ncbi:MAG: hypothetical protein KDC98_15930 [Planctomycetes bacterium]|nr:hypothetical protein [Planctomycetota bacterium]
MSPLASPRANYSVVAGSDAGAPSQRMWGGSATDGTRLFVFGGRNAPAGAAGSVYYNGLYAYDTVTSTWATLSAEGDPNAPSVGFRQSMAYDPAGNRLVIYGGRTSATGTILSDCHVFDLATNLWSQIPNPTPGTTGPLDTDGGKLAYDATSGNLVQFGGTDTLGNKLGDTWLLSGTTWTQVTGLVAGSTAPEPRNIHGMASRSAPYNDIVVVGGQINNGANVNMNDTWRWDGTTSTWSLITPINSTVPVSWVSGNELVYDAVREVLVINNGPGTNVAPSNTTNGSTSWVSEYDCVTNEWRAFAAPANMTNQRTDDPIIGNVQRFFSAFVDGKVLIWSGQNTTTIGDADLSKIKEYQAAPLASALPYGSGCGGLTLAAGSNPWGGRDWTLTASGFSATSLGAVVISLGQDNSALPAPGMPGCSLLVNSSVVLTTALLVPLAGTASFTAAMPLVNGLGGLPMNSQAFALDSATNMVTSSNGIAGKLGAN